MSWVGAKDSPRRTKSEFRVSSKHPERKDLKEFAERVQSKVDKERSGKK